MENSAQSLYGLIFGCPLEDENLKKACPLKKVWELSPKDRIELVQSMSNEEIREIEKFHNALECKKHKPEKISEGIQLKLDLI
jgi:hypothetical protein